MSIQIKLFLLIASILLATFFTISYFNFQQATHNAEKDLFEQADKVRNILMSYRQVGQTVFLKEKLPLTDKNLGLLPAYAIGSMSKTYSHWDKSGFSFANVSDKPRNPEHQADKLELEIMDFFRKNEEQDTVFKAFYNDNNEKYYIYARPIWIKKPCLKCHSTPEKAPKTIRDRYTTAYNYQMGDLRGLLSIKIPGNNIEQRAWDDFISNAKILVLGMFIIFITTILIIRNSIINPIQLLLSAMKDVTQGNYSKRIDGLSGEFGHMQKGFNRMGQELEKNQQQLESRVETRTQQLSQANIEISNSLETLKNTQQQLVEAEKLASLGALVAGVAHEINTPIGVGVTASTHINSLTEQLIQKLENETLSKEDLDNYVQDSQEAGQIIYSNLARAAELIKSFKQIAVDQTHDNHRIINVFDYINECLLSIKPVLKKNLYDIKIQGDEQIQINCNPGQFSQIISNLFINSIKHAFDEDQPGQLTLEFHQEKNQAFFHYYDNGHGIPSEHLDKIFDPFFTTARHIGGTGLGLSTVYNIIVQNMSGSLRCESKKGQGTHFYFTLACEPQNMENKKN